MNKIYVIKSDNNLVYNGGYTYEETEEVFSQDYEMVFDTLEEVEEEMKTLIASVTYLTIETRYQEDER